MLVKSRLPPAGTVSWACTKAVISLLKALIFYEEDNSHTRIRWVENMHILMVVEPHEIMGVNVFGIRKSCPFSQCSLVPTSSTLLSSISVGPPTVLVVPRMCFFPS